MNSHRFLVRSTISLLALGLAAPGLKAQIIKPDLTVTQMSVSSSIKAGTWFNFTVACKQHNITGSGACKLAIYYSTDSKITTSDTRLFILNIPKLGWQQSIKPYSNKAFLPSSAAQGKRYIGAIVDYTNVVKESNESNNTRSDSFTAISRKADLTPTVLVAPSVITAGQPATFDCTVKNQGEVSSSANSYIYYYLSRGDAVWQSTDQLITSRKIGALSVNRTVLFRHTFTVPTTIVGSNITYLIARLYNGGAAELSTTNNFRARLITPRPVPTQNPRFTLNGDSTGDVMGFSVASAGDVNGDGYDDIIAGAPFDDNRGSNSGMARIYNGRTGAILRSINGDSAGDNFGYSVAGVGDTNGDGFDDVLIGAPFDDNRGTSSGMVRLYSGRDWRVLRTLNGSSAGDNFGFSVGQVGDADGDGYDDYIVGAPRRFSSRGYAYVYSGRTGATLLTLAGGTSAQMGYSVSGAGDVDNDGFADVIVGAPFTSRSSSLRSTGAAYVYSVRARRLLFFFQGETASDYLGWSVDGAGDVNKDGAPDLVVGVPYDDNRGTSSGSARIYSGKDGRLLRVFSGLAAGDTLGYRVAGAGDVNGDGHADVIAGAPFADPRGSSSGRAMVFSGRTGGLLFDFVGESGGDYMGWQVASAGDLNYDGIADLLLGVYGDDNRGSNSGSVRVFRSSGKLVARTRDYGNGCPGSAGKLPRNISDNPVIGQNTRLRLRSAPPASGCSLNISLSKSALSLAPMGSPGCTAWVLPLMSLRMTTLTDGTAELATVTPNDTRLVGLDLYTQWWVVDPKANTLGLIVSEGLQLTVGR